MGHFIYKVLTQKGAEGWDSLSVGWEPWHEARPMIRARVIAPDFTVHTLDPNTITEAPARGGDYKTYSDGKTAARAVSRHRARRGGRRGIHRDRNRAAVSSGPRGARCASARRRCPWRTATWFSMLPRRCRCAPIFCCWLASSRSAAESGGRVTLDLRRWPAACDRQPRAVSASRGGASSR